MFAFIGYLKCCCLNGINERERSFEPDVYLNFFTLNSLNSDKLEAFSNFSVIHNHNKILITYNILTKPPIKKQTIHLN